MYCAAISCETDLDAQAEYINDAKSRRIEVLAPKLNSSSKGFEVSGNAILFGYSGLKGLGDKAIDGILEHRPYYSASDFFKKIVDYKIKVPKQVIEILIKVGIFDEFGLNRRVLLDTYDRFLTDYKTVVAGKSKTKKDTSSFCDENYFLSALDYQDFSLLDILGYERKYLGIYLSGNPYDSLKEIFTNYKLHSYSDINEHNPTGNIFAEILEVKEVKVKSSGKLMGILKLLDKTNTVFELPIFSDHYTKNLEIIDVGKYLIFSVKLGSRGISCSGIQDITELVSKKIEEEKSEAIISGGYIKFVEPSALKKILLRKERLAQMSIPEKFNVPIRLYYITGDYIFKVGVLTFPLNNDGIRELNSIKDIELIIDR